VLVVQDPDGRVLLERRPARGIWGGLYSLPELGEGDATADWCARHVGAPVASERELEVVEHAFTHFDLDLVPRLLRLGAPPSVVADRDDWLWQPPGAELRVGVPSPVAGLLREIRER
jgi:A/G-specific adenine glycosylase